MLWPERGDTWRLGAKPAQIAFAAAAEAIAKFEPVTVGVSRYHFKNARKILSKRVRTIEMSSDDAWMRDVGPTFVINRETAQVHGIDWQFNAWGGHAKGIYSSWQQDDLVATAGSVAVSLVGMYKALGGGWEIRGGQDFVRQDIKKQMAERTNWGDLLSPQQVQKVTADPPPTLIRPDW